MNRVDYVIQKMEERKNIGLIWTDKGWTKTCLCGQKINYLSKTCPYCHAAT